MLHPDLLLAKDLVYKPSGLILQNLKIEDESADYGASEFTIKNRSVKFRVGKITPTKVGQFVTFWKRIGEGPILPYEFTDAFDFLVVSVRAENHFGQFVFPKTVLCEKGIVSCHGKEGKRAMRIYPPWDKADNSQAKKTQAWQLQYFIQFSDQSFDVTRLKHLFDASKMEVEMNSELLIGVE
ncbi:MAG: MepB family protein [Parachlamydiaceae bacterium]|nr:MepB family protein [Parachlamydiaceae bacterium]